MVEIFYDRGKKELVQATYFFQTGKVWSRHESNFLHMYNICTFLQSTSKLSANTNSNAENEFLILFQVPKLKIFYLMHNSYKKKSRNLRNGKNASVTSFIMN